MVAPLQTALAEGRRALAAGDTARAVDTARKITQRWPGAAVGWLALAQASLEAQAHETCAQACDRALALRPDLIEAQITKARLEQAQGFAHDAEATLRAALAKAPDHAQAHCQLGNLLRQQDRPQEAVTAYRAALALRPGYVAALTNLGNVLRLLGELEEARRNFEAALARKPNRFAALYGLGRVLHAQGAAAQAVAPLRHAVQQKPDDALALHRLGLALDDCGASSEAVSWHRAARELAPDKASFESALGVSLMRSGAPEAALPHLEAAAQQDPEHALHHRNLGNALHLLGRFDRAVAAFDRALALDPGMAAAQTMRLFDLAQMCAWTEDEPQYLEELGCEGAPISPWMALHLEDAPGRQLQRSRLWAKGFVGTRQVFARPVAPARRLRVGYVSADFHDHATMHLLAGVFRCHDPEKVEVTALSHGPLTHDPMQRAMQAQVSAFHDISSAPDAEVMALAARSGLDIAVDLKGYTEGGRPSLFAAGLAPVQIAHLGYPGSLGSPAIDYLVADSFVVPTAQRDAYDEALIYLPDCYQPNNHERKIARTGLTRSDVDLPEDAVVLCSFNASYKLKPLEFGIWLRVLAEVPQAVLWLLAPNEWAKANLCSVAKAAGIAPERLIFAPPLPQAEHLERLQLADLMVDTFHCNAHTTASDALWAGLPVLTMAGQQFAARVAGSLLMAQGVPELVTSTPETYAERLLTLCRDGARLGDLRCKVGHQRQSGPLFDSASYTRALEQAYVQAHEIWCAGDAPRDIKMT